MSINPITSPSRRPAPLVISDEQIRPETPSPQENSPLPSVQGFSWVDLRTLLFTAHQLNRFEPLPESLKARLSSQIRHFFEKDQSNPDLLYLLGILSVYNYVDTRPHALSIIEILKTRFPKLNLYLKGNNQIITPKGMDLILKIFEKKYSWKEGEIKTLDIRELPSVIETFETEVPPLGKAGYIFYCPGKDHLVPAFIKKENGFVNICVTDSKGIRDTYWLEPLQKLSEENKSLKFYVYSPLRQRDGFTCPIFSLLDLRNQIESDEAGRDIFDFLKTTAPKDTIKPLGLGFSFTLLPPEMMKVTQSQKQLEQYISSLPKSFSQSFIPVVQRRSPSPQDGPLFVFHSPNTMKDTVKRNTFYLPDGSTVNKYIERKYLTFLLDLISQVLKDE